MVSTTSTLNVSTSLRCLLVYDQCSLAPQRDDHILCAAFQQISSPPLPPRGRRALPCRSSRLSSVSLGMRKSARAISSSGSSLAGAGLRRTLDTVLPGKLGGA
ncbi:MAG: hypothetical protein MZV64_19260 [Ignavibacteriales bacterium]|nr:hypothetical protein [Ignavibacteriales bacterium]